MMTTARATHPALLALLPALLLAGCGITVQEGEHGTKTVDIGTPLGSLSVNTDVAAADTGLRVYPGARPARDNGHGSGNANVNISTPVFGVKVVATKFEVDDAPEAVIDFYRNEMQAYGTVTECRGNIDFNGSGASKRPVCRERPASREIQLVAGTKDRHRIVVAKPRGSGSEFAVVYVQARGD